MFVHLLRYLLRETKHLWVCPNWKDVCSSLKNTYSQSLRYLFHFDFYLFNPLVIFSVQMQIRRQYVCFVLYLFQCLFIFTLRFSDLLFILFIPVIYDKHRRCPLLYPRHHHRCLLHHHRHHYLEEDSVALPSAGENNTVHKKWWVSCCLFTNMDRTW